MNDRPTSLIRSGERDKWELKHTTRVTSQSNFFGPVQISTRGPLATVPLNGGGGGPKFFVAEIGGSQFYRRRLFVNLGPPFNASPLNTQLAYRSGTWTENSFDTISHTHIARKTHALGYTFHTFPNFQWKTRVTVTSHSSEHYSTTGGGGGKWVYLFWRPGAKLNNIALSPPPP